MISDQSPWVSLFFVMSFQVVAITKGKITNFGPMSKFTIAVHGGAGTISKKSMTPEKEAAYLKALDDAMKAGYHVLEKKGEALDAVKAAVIELENNILFNAGKGSVFTNTGTHEMDASIMDRLA